MTGLEVLEQLARQEQAILANRPPIIVMTAHGTIQSAVEAMKYGAADFLTKPLDIDHLTLRIQKALDREGLQSARRRVARGSRIPVQHHRSGHAGHGVTH